MLEDSDVAQMDFYLDNGLLLLAQEIARDQEELYQLEDMKLKMLLNDFDPEMAGMLDEFNSMSEVKEAKALSNQQSNEIVSNEVHRYDFTEVAANEKGEYANELAEQNASENNPNPIVCHGNDCKEHENGTVVTPSGALSTGLSVLASVAAIISMSAF